MSKKVIISIIVAVVVIGGGVAIWLNLKNADEPKVSTTQPESSGQNDSETSISKLMSSGKNVTCTFAFTDDEGNNSVGVVYVAGNKRMRGDITTTPAGQPELKTSIITVEDTNYMWDNATKKGIKTTTSPDQTQSDESGQDQSVDKDKNYAFKCSDWKVDDSMFNPPSDVTFTDFNAQLQQPGQPQGQTTSPAAACAQIPDATARAQCESAAQQTQQ